MTFSWSRTRHQRPGGSGSFGQFRRRLDLAADRWGNFQFLKTQIAARANRSGLSEVSLVTDGICRLNLALWRVRLTSAANSSSGRVLSDLRSIGAGPVYDGKDGRSVGESGRLGFEEVGKVRDRGHFG